ncbi:cell division inhibitor SepF [Caldanaerobius fijiensis DSM 17918]|uniref:Cell division protein SepF n=1 Tax=Caldanaerobius fijiensis DSM 17918 TaxID=1121256 RepID=A0A1M4SZ21_9THEO|nr:cell division inhibitor SepF [Caldanaerobius fijiensis DSM 17918]
MNVIEKIMSYLGLEESEDDEERSEDYENKNYEPFVKQKPKVVNIHSNSHIKVIISRPVSYDEVTMICDELKARKPVIVNLQDMKPDEAERVLDFLAGAVYALEGVVKKISSGIFLVVPSNVDIENILAGDN